MLVPALAVVLTLNFSGNGCVPIFGGFGSLTGIRTGGLVGGPPLGTVGVESASGESPDVSSSVSCFLVNPTPKPTPRPRRRRACWRAPWRRRPRRPWRATRPPRTCPTSSPRSSHGDSAAATCSVARPVLGSVGDAAVGGSHCEEGEGLEGRGGGAGGGGEGRGGGGARGLASHEGSYSVSSG